MDPIIFGTIVLVATPAAAAVARFFRRRKQDPKSASTPPPRLLSDPRDAQILRVGDVVTYLEESYWLAGELSLKREGVQVLRLFLAPEKGADRWLAVLRDGLSVWILEADSELAAVGFPGVELPLGGRTMRRSEFGNVALMPQGECAKEWEGMGRFAMFRAHDTVAIYIESAVRGRLALKGREIPRQLLQKMG